MAESKFKVGDRVYAPFHAGTNKLHTDADGVYVVDHSGRKYYFKKET